MKILKIKFHSIIDVITNSSTEMFMDYSRSLQPAKNLINEILRLSNVDKFCDDVFDISLTEQDEATPAELIIKAKMPEYENLVTLIEKFLSSIEVLEFMA